MIEVCLGVSLWGTGFCRLGRRRPGGRGWFAVRGGLRRGSGRRRGFWVKALQGKECVGGGAKRDVVVPARPRAAVGVVQTEAVLEFAVVVLDAPAQFGEPHQDRLRGRARQV